MGLEPEEAAVPDARAGPSAARCSSRAARVTKCSSAAWKPARSSREPLRARPPASSRGRSRHPSSSAHRPSPRSRRRSRDRSRSSATASRFVDTATTCAGRRLAERSDDPGSERARVRHRLDGREGLRGDDHEGLGRIEVAGRLDRVRAVHVRDEAERQVAAAVVAQRLIRHRRPEIGAADPDVDHVPDRLAGCTQPGAAANAIAERSHAVEHLVDVAHDVLAVDDERALPRHPQGDVEDGAVLGDVDVLAAEHRVAPLLDPTLARERGEQPKRLRRHPVLREIRVDRRRLDGEVGEPLRGRRRTASRRCRPWMSSWWRSSAGPRRAIGERWRHGFLQSAGRARFVDSLKFTFADDEEVHVPTATPMQLGMVGLGRMGANIVRRLMRDGHRCAGTDVGAEAVAALAGGGNDRARRSPAELVAALDSPAHRLGDGSRRARSPSTRSPTSPSSSSRATRSSTAATPATTTTSAAPATLAEKGINYLDVGTSGGVFGLERGFCLMVGGTDRGRRRGSRRSSPRSRRASAPPSARPGATGDPAPEENGWLHCGPAGAGHFVKMVHNGIEYGLMAAYAEGLNILHHANAGGDRARAGRRDRAARRSPSSTATTSTSPRSPSCGGAAASSPRGCSTSPPRRSTSRPTSRASPAASRTPVRAAGRRSPRSTPARRRPCSPPRCTRASPHAARTTSATGALRDAQAVRRPPREADLRAADRRTNVRTPSRHASAREPALSALGIDAFGRRPTPTPDGSRAAATATRSPRFIVGMPSPYTVAARTTAASSGRGGHAASGTEAASVIEDAVSNDSLGLVELDIDGLDPALGSVGYWLRP